MPDKERGLQTTSRSEGTYDHPGPHLFQEIVRTHQVLIGAFSLQVGMPSARMEVLRQLENSETYKPIQHLKPEHSLHPLP